MFSVSRLASPTRRLALSRRPRVAPSSSRTSSDTLTRADQAWPAPHRTPSIFGTTSHSMESPETGRILDSTSRPQPTHPHPITGRRQINEAGVGAPPNGGQPAAGLNRLLHSPQPVAAGRRVRSGFMVKPAAVSLSAGSVPQPRPSTHCLGLERSDVILPAPLAARRLAPSHRTHSGRRTAAYALPNTVVM